MHSQAFWEGVGFWVFLFLFLGGFGGDFFWGGGGVFLLGLFALFCFLIHPHCFSSSRSLNRPGPTINPWGMLLITGPQLGFVSLNTTLRACPFSQFSVNFTVCLSTLYFISLSMRILWETVSEGLLKSR